MGRYAVFVCEYCGVYKATAPKCSKCEAEKIEATEANDGPKRAD